MKILDDLKGMGYSVTLDGENIRLRYSATGKQPVEAGPLIEELREHKGEAVEYLKAQRPLPTLDADGTLDWLPFDSDPRYHWWRGGQTVSETEAELRRWKH